MLHGEQDRLVPVANVDYLEDALRTGRHPDGFTKNLLPDGNHFIPWQQPAALRAALDRVLANPRPAAIKD
jgi:pimeloyl-ACP methyl ester carboxylesterase